MYLVPLATVQSQCVSQRVFVWVSSLPLTSYMIVGKLILLILTFFICKEGLNQFQKVEIIKRYPYDALIQEYGKGLVILTIIFKAEMTFTEYIICNMKNASYVNSPNGQIN